MIFHRCSTALCAHSAALCPGISALTLSHPDHLHVLCVLAIVLKPLSRASTAAPCCCCCSLPGRDGVLSASVSGIVLIQFLWITFGGGSAWIRRVCGARGYRIFTCSNKVVQASSASATVIIIIIIIISIPSAQSFLSSLQYPYQPVASG